ncbi:hypothetical protein F0562_013501 [Nyssa sinensis]|uniref:Uncharacterized protein n=1 Tax=Nyssa sinensis TaxID=561372 RepID=A0A5J4ZKZ5_9ASTE|nr:hypothetical protein F0562_013501 [Nyssa sinensis]
MGEKGGKGFTIPKGGKSSLKSPAFLKGNDDSSAKSKRGRKVQFDSEDPLEAKISLSSKSGGKVDFPIAKGDWGKGGKGDKIANGGKSPVTKEPPALELKIEQELPKNAKILMDCEAAHILEGIQEQMVILSEDPTIKIPTAFDRGLQYAKSSSHYTSPQSVRRVLEYPFCQLLSFFLLYVCGSVNRKYLLFSHKEYGNSLTQTSGLSKNTVFLMARYQSQAEILTF